MTLETVVIEPNLQPILEDIASRFAPELGESEEENRKLLRSLYGESVDYKRTGGLQVDHRIRVRGSARLPERIVMVFNGLAASPTMTSQLRQSLQLFVDTFREAMHEQNFSKVSMSYDHCDSDEYGYTRMKLALGEKLSIGVSYGVHEAEILHLKMDGVAKLYKGR